MLFLAALTATLSATPSMAQLGPAGVPGVFGLAESITGSPSPAPAKRSGIAQPAVSANDCSLPANAAWCQAQEMQKQARAACSGQRGSQLKACVSNQLQAMNCKKSADPARCVQHATARQLCSPKLGEAHRQCLREKLTAKN